MLKTRMGAAESGRPPLPFPGKGADEPELDAADKARLLQRALDKARASHRREADRLRKTVDGLTAKNEALAKRCDVLRLALPPEAAAAAEAALPADDDVAVAEAAGGGGDDAAGGDASDDASSDDDDVDDDEETEQERRLAALELEGQCMDSLKKHYETTIEKLELEVAALEREREQLQQKTATSESEAATRVLRERARKLETAIARLRTEAKRATDEVDRCGGLQARAQQDARRLRAEVEEARKRRGELQKRLQRRDADHARAAREWKREAKRLKRDNERVRGEKTKLVQRFAPRPSGRRRLFATVPPVAARSRGVASACHAATAMLQKRKHAVPQKSIENEARLASRGRA